MKLTQKLAGVGLIFVALLTLSIATARPVFAYGSWDSVTPQPIAPGQTLTVDTGASGTWESPPTKIYFFWNGSGTPIAGPIPTTGSGPYTAHAAFAIPSPLTDGTYTIQACEGDTPFTACNPAAITTNITVQNPVTPSATPAPTPKPTAKPTAAPTASPSPTPTPTVAPTAAPTATAAPAVVIATPAPTASSTPSPAPNALVKYDPISQPKSVVNLQVTAFTLLALGGGGGLALAGMHGGAAATAAGGAAHHAAKKGGSTLSAKTKYAKHKRDDEAFGDRSRLWRWPGTATLDGLAAVLPARLIRFSPVLGRVLADATYLRAIYGSLSLLPPVVGAIFGVLAAQDVNGTVLAAHPSSAIGLAVVGVFDAFAGVIGVLAFLIVAAFHGGLTSAPELRTALALGGLWFAVPLIASAARPLRRAPSQTLEQRFDRVADVVIASLIGAWAVQKVVSGISGFAGYHIPLSDDANLAALVVLGALVVRIAFETLAANHFPARLTTVQPPMAFPSERQRLLSTVLATGIFLFIAVTIVDTWQLWVAAGLFLFPKVLSVFERRFPNRPSIYRFLPRGIVKTVLMLLVAKALGNLLSSAIHDPHQVVGDAMIVLAIPGVVLSILGVFGREGPEALTWTHRIIGVAVFAVGVLLVTGLIGI